MFIGLDLGSTYTKAALFDRNKVFTSLSKVTPAPKTQGIRFEIDGDSYANKVLSILDTLWNPQVEGILISTQMHGCILTDESFHPLTPYLSWRDGLGAKWYHKLKEHYGEKAIASSGVPWKGNLALCALLGRREEGEKLPEHGLFCTLGGYIIGCLTGRHICHMTNAAPTGMADIRNGSWNEAIIDATELSGLTFPQILTDISVCGTWRGIPIYPDFGDQQVCAFGANLALEETLHISVGTAGLIGILTPQWGEGHYENRPWLTPGCYLRTVSGQPGGRHLTAFAENLRQIAEDITQKPIQIDEVLQYLSFSEGMPSGDTDSLWQACGTTTAQAFIQNLYLSYAQAYQSAAAQMEIPVKSISFSGGCVAKNAALRSRIVESFHCPFIPGDHDVWVGMRKLCGQISSRKPLYN